MNGWIATFTPQTWLEFQKAGSSHFGLPEKRAYLAGQVEKGDILIAVLSGARRIVGILEVTGPSFYDETPIWSVDTFPQRIPVVAKIQLTPETGALFSETDPPRFESGKSGGWGVWMQTGLKRIGKHEDVEKLYSILEEKSLNPKETPLTKKQLDYVPKFASKNQQKWLDIKSLVVDSDEDLPTSEIVRRALANGTVDGTYPDLVKEAKRALSVKVAPTTRVTENITKPEDTTSSDSDRFGSKNLEEALKSHRQKVKKALVSEMQNLDSYLFEKLVLLVLEAVGLEDGYVTERSKDGGVDVRGMLRSVGVVRQPACVQVKRWKGNVGRPDVQKLRGTLAPNELGILVTLSNFTKEAREDAAGGSTHRSIHCMTGSQLAGLMIEHQIGVRRSNAVILELYDLSSIFIEDDADTR